MLLGSVVRSSVLALETDGLVDEQVTCDRVAGSEDSEANDNTEGNQLSGDLAESSKALRDSVGSLFLVGHRAHHAAGGLEGGAHGSCGVHGD